MVDIERLASDIRLYLGNSNLPPEMNTGQESASFDTTDLEEKIQSIPLRGLQYIDSALQKWSSGSESLTREELLGFEAIILVIGRPAISITPNGLFQVPKTWILMESKAFWNKINGRRNAYSVGVINDPNNNPLGSAILISNDLIVTNWHVLTAVRKSLKGNKITPSSGIFINFGAFLDLEANFFIAIDECIYKKPDIDIAILKLNTSPSKYSIEPVLIEYPQKRVANFEVYTMGYPFNDGDEDADILVEIFGFERGTKKCCPGKIIDFNNRVIGHDCSTLQGSSGSGLFRLTTGHLVGIHYSGYRRQDNKAIRVDNFLSSLPHDIFDSLNFVSVS